MLLRHIEIRTRLAPSAPFGQTRGGETATITMADEGTVTAFAWIDTGEVDIKLVQVLG